MPKSHRLSQCVYKEGGRRCMRSGDGEPPLCRAHKIAASEQARQAQSAAARTPRAAVGDLINDFFTGRPWSVDRVARAVSEVDWSLGGVFGGGFSPDIDTGAERDDGRFVPPDNFRPPPRWHREQAPPPPPPKSNAAEIHAARRELGFGPSDQLTEELIKDRKRQLARKFHSDLRGGSDEKMKRVNAAADTLVESLSP